MRGRRDFLTLGIAGLWLVTACGCDVVSTAPKAAQTTASLPRGGRYRQRSRRRSPVQRGAPVGGVHHNAHAASEPVHGRRDRDTSWHRIGFVWDEAGHVVTNLHVLQGATAAQVVLHDQSTHRAALVGVSRGHDLGRSENRCARRCPTTGHHRRSDDLQVGQSIFAIGNPFGLSATLTTGIVSALGREIAAVGGGTIENAIQTARPSTQETPVGRCLIAPVGSSESTPRSTARPVHRLVSASRFLWTLCVV